MAAPPEYTWECMAPEVPFAPRDGAEMVALNGRLFVLGGWNQFSDEAHRGAGVGNFDSEVCSEVWVSDDSGKHWTQLPDAPWEGRHYFGLVVHDSMIWIVGGDNSSGPYQTDIWNSPDGKEWTQVLAQAPWPERALHMVCVFDGSIWVMGGQTNAPAQTRFIDGTADQFESEETAVLRDVWRTNDGANWERVTDSAPWAPRGMITGANGGVAVHRGRMWILGGGYVGKNGVTLSSLKYDQELEPRYEEREYYNDIWSSADGKEWTLELAEAPWCTRHYHDVAVFDEKLWILGGAFCRAATPEEVGTDGNMNDVWYSEDGLDWAQLPGTPWSLRHACGVFSILSDGLYMTGGNTVTFFDEERDRTPADGAANPNVVQGQYKTNSVWRPFGAF